MLMIPKIIVVSHNKNLKLLKVMGSKPNHSSSYRKLKHITTCYKTSASDLDRRDGIVFTPTQVQQLYIPLKYIVIGRKRSN